MRWTVRLRLTLLYSGLFLVAGALLVALIYLLVEHSPFPGPPTAPDPPDLPDPLSPPSPLSPLSPLSPPDGLEPPVTTPGIEAEQAASLRRLLVNSLIALVVMAFASMLLGWLMAGRVLRPLGDMTATVRRITADRLDRRLAAPGPDDELKELADTFDELLDRLEAAFTAQRRFVANASHELRTPLTLQRAMAEVALGDPEADAGALRAVLERLLAAGRHQERLIEALLTLARSQQGLQHREPLDLALITAQALDQREPPPEDGNEDPNEDPNRDQDDYPDEAQSRAGSGDRDEAHDDHPDPRLRRSVGGPGGRRVRVERALGPAPASGDRALLERLVSNLLDNAVRHNVPGGWISVSTAVRSGRPTLRVANSGPVIPPDRAGTLLQPFQRLETRRRADGDGLGLGLSIVAAIVQAHDGALNVRPLPEGGLEVTVTL
ncbi:sensor histidine kinase [Nonomuraea cavernae]|uniref:histidine kinase n=1 Tax=Nonomuraea cavernae TaxID=2045107 RepID=A0A917ZA62_9ACTN|nr:ATP-binding protein [Nonomuraea cavernae]MCA2188823.1 HAMP domain-containing protein [Nonomuraea cavernae]GGO78349.1 two-component sensor histidine kinase [Nonomuraea cavernae]